MTITPSKKASTSGRSSPNSPRRLAKSASAQSLSQVGAISSRRAARARSAPGEPSELTRSLRYAKVFLVLLAPVTLLLSWDQILHPSLSVAIFAQNGVYGLFAAAFVPILFGVFVEKADWRVIFTASLAALFVHFGMYYGEITVYHNNPGVTAACALLVSLAVALAGSAVLRMGGKRP